MGDLIAFASRAPQADIARLKARMGWELPWYTITDGFDADFGVDEWHGHNVFFRDGERLFRTYFINSRGDEAMGSTWSYLDITPLGRQETWVDSPKGYPQRVLDMLDIRAVLNGGFIRIRSNFLVPRFVGFIKRVPSAVSQRIFASVIVLHR